MLTAKVSWKWLLTGSVEKWHQVHKERQSDWKSVYVMQKTFIKIWIWGKFDTVILTMEFPHVYQIFLKETEKKDYLITELYNDTCMYFKGQIHKLLLLFFKGSYNNYCSMLLMAPDNKTITLYLLFLVQCTNSPEWKWKLFISRQGGPQSCNETNKQTQIEMPLWSELQPQKVNNSIVLCSLEESKMPRKSRIIIN